MSKSLTLTIGVLVLIVGGVLFAMTRQVVATPGVLQSGGEVNGASTVLQIIDGGTSTPIPTPRPQ